MGFLRNWVLPNWQLKLLALGLSFLLWSTYTAEPPVEVGFLAPVEFSNVPPELELAGELPTQVHLRLRGRPVLLRRLAPGDLGVRIDLKGSAPGETVIRLTADHVKTPFGVAVARIAPAEIRVLLAPRDRNHR